MAERRKSRSRDGMARGYARSAEKNRAAREQLEPLGPGERPGAVTVGAALSGLVALIFWASAAVALFSDATVSGSRPEVPPLAVFALLMSGMAYGMWKARYWAVLGFQMLLVLFLLAAVLGLLTAETVVQAVATGLLVIGLGLLFYKMVRAMARIQMPTPRDPG